MTKEDIIEDVIHSIVHYRDSEHYRVKYNVKPCYGWVVKNRKENVDKIEGLYETNLFPKCVKRYCKIFIITIEIGLITKPTFKVFHRELEEVCSEIFAKFKILNKNKINNNRYINYTSIYINNNRYIFDNYGKKLYDRPWYYTNHYPNYYYNMDFCVYNDSKIYSVSNTNKKV